MVADMTTPPLAASMLRFLSRPRTQAPSVPVQAPVIGYAIPTNNMIPHKPNLRIFGPSFIRVRTTVLSKTFA